MHEKWDSNTSESWYLIWSSNDTQYLRYSDNNVTYVNYYLRQPHVAAIFILSYFLIFSLCMVGNSVVCFIVMRNKHMHTVTNFFILNLAISDLLIGIFCMPTTLLDNIIAGWPFGSTMCKVSGLVQGTSVAASVFTLVAIAADRFRCVVHPFKPKLSVRASLLTVVTIWLLALGVMSPSAVTLHVQEDRRYRVRLGGQDAGGPVRWCREAWPRRGMRRVYTSVLFAAVYLAPLCLIVLLYARIGVSLSRAAAAHAGARGPAQWHVSKKKQKVIRMLVTVALLFVLSWLPLWTLMMLSDHAALSAQQLRVVNVYVYPIAHWLAFCNSSVNPIIYGFFNDNFRTGFQEAFRLQVCRKRAKPQEAYVLRARNTVTTHASGQLSQETAAQIPQGENLLCGKSPGRAKQDIMMEELGEATNISEI